MKYTRINRWTGNYCDSLKSWIEKDVPIGHSLGSDAYQMLLSSYIPFTNKLALELVINGLDSSESSGIDRLKDWPENVACDSNIGNNELPPSEKIFTYYTAGTLHYLLKENILAKLNIDFRKKETLWNLLISYSYK